MSERVVFHVGYPKTGSTSLQKHLFATSGRIADLSHFSRSGEDEDALAVRLLGRNEKDSQVAAQLWHDAVGNMGSNAQALVISKEDLLTNCDAPATLFNRLAALAPNAEIVAVIRDQADLIRSRYDMYPSIDRASGVAIPVSDYLDWAFGAGAEWFDRLKYDSALAPAVELFGRDHVHVFSFRRLFGGDRPDIPRFASVFGVGPATVQAAMNSPPQNEFELYAARRMIRRLLGPVHASWFLPRAVIRKIKIGLARSVKFQRTEFPPEQVARIRAYYADDNAALRDRFPEIGTL